MTSLVEVTLGTTCEIVLDNPPMNVVSRELTVELRDALTAVARHAAARALIVTGAGGRAFCAGSDIAEFEALHGRVAEDKLLLEGLVYRQLARTAVPTIAAIEGHALGGGLELALACDLRVASEKSKLGLPELKLGVLPGSGGTQRLARVVGLARAKEMILLGQVLTAERAEQLGLVNEVTPTGGALARARELADEIATRGPRAARLAKRLIDESLDRSLDDGLALELDASEEVFSTQDMLEGARAFKEKRSAQFTDS
ncbi:enoyl-CoA hydratase/isomerase family protein [Georgenia subflava]|uniref:enoyl-CoA hydratase n=1 Tax=Georgenia subflava TaxID=1622177 RepID=A0A6N7EJF5_9MICO|nr:enoyl-CoA hydratase-related protein [Georgenia subflava]MPV36877.1 enoyl-CoA hydratase/isomerase family protein [Georgenia subflava]